MPIRKAIGKPLRLLTHCHLSGSELPWPSDPSDELAWQTLRLDELAWQHPPPSPALPHVEAKKLVRPPSREGKRVLSIYLPPEAWKQLRLLSLNLETPTQALGEEAINLLFEKHGLNRIA